MQARQSMAVEKISRASIRLPLSRPRQAARINCTYYRPMPSARGNVLWNGSCSALHGLRTHMLRTHILPIFASPHCML